jgi:agmatine/peptidylarginine deiminase
MNLFYLISTLLFTSHLPIETQPVGTLMLSMDDVGLSNSNIFSIWTTIIKSAQRQNIDVIIYLVKGSNLDSIKNNLIESKIDTKKVNFITEYKTNSIWMRDYGPILYFDKFNRLSVFDLKYLARRDLDDNMPKHFSQKYNLPYAKSELRMEGGNLLSNGDGVCITSDKVLKHNMRQNIESELRKIGCYKIIIMKSLKYDQTQHVDMWLFIRDKSTVIMGMYNNIQDLEDHKKMLINYEILKKNGFKVLLMPMPSHCNDGSYTCNTKDFITRSYLNVLPLNNEIIVPIFRMDRQFEDEAIYKWNSYTGKKIITVEADDIIREYGIVHCMTRTGPKLPIF